MNKIKFFISVGIVSSVIGGLLPAFAGDNLGKELFMKKDAKKTSCNTCHPKGGSNGAIVEGKKVPNLKKTVGKLSYEKLAEHVKKESTTHANFAFTADELTALIKFVETLGKK